MMFYANIFRMVFPYLAPAAFGLVIGWWLAVKIYTAEQVAELKAEISRVQAVNKELVDAAGDYEKRKQKRQESKVIYVEKPHYVDCRPDRVWLRDFNNAIKADNAGESNR